MYKWRLVSEDFVARTKLDGEEAYSSNVRSPTDQINLNKASSVNVFLTRCLEYDVAREPCHCRSFRAAMGCPLSQPWKNVVDTRYECCKMHPSLLKARCQSPCYLVAVLKSSIAFIWSQSNDIHKSGTSRSRIASNVTKMAIHMKGLVINGDFSPCVSRLRMSIHGVMRFLIGFQGENVFNVSPLLWVCCWFRAPQNSFQASGSWSTTEDDNDIDENDDTDGVCFWSGRFGSLQRWSNPKVWITWTISWRVNDRSSSQSKNRKLAWPLMPISRQRCILRLYVSQGLKVWTSFASSR